MLFQRTNPLSEVVRQKRDASYSLQTYLISSSSVGSPPALVHSAANLAVPFQVLSRLTALNFVRFFQMMARTNVVRGI